jgi:hypothetical protein
LKIEERWGYCLLVGFVIKHYLPFRLESQECEGYWSEIFFVMLLVNATSCVWSYGCEYNMTIDCNKLCNKNWVREQKWEQRDTVTYWHSRIYPNRTNDLSISPPCWGQSPSWKSWDNARLKGGVVSWPDQAPIIATLTMLYKCHKLVMWICVKRLHVAVGQAAMGIGTVHTIMGEMCGCQSCEWSLTVSTNSIWHHYWRICSAARQYRS